MQQYEILMRPSKYVINIQAFNIYIETILAIKHTKIELLEMLLSLLTHNSTTLTNTNTRHDWHGIFAFWIFTSNEKKPQKIQKHKKTK